MSCGSSGDLCERENATKKGGFSDDGSIGTNETMQTKNTQLVSPQSSASNSPVKVERNSNKQKILVTLAERNDTIQHKQTNNTMPRFFHTDTHPHSLGWPGHSEWMIVNPHLSSSSRVLEVEIERDDEVMLAKQSQKHCMIRKQASNKQEYVPSNSDLPTLTHRCKEWKERHD